MDEIDKLLSSQICRVCLEDKTNDECTAMEKSHKVKLSALCIEMKLDITENPRICNECNLQLTSATTFREKCLDTENKLISFWTDNASKTINLAENINNIVPAIKSIKEETVETISENFDDKNNINVDFIDIKNDYDSSSDDEKPLLMENALTCNLCGKGFNSSSLLRRHKFNCKKKHSENSEETETDKKVKIKKEKEVFLCSICGISCNTQKRLQIHMRTHLDKPYKCDQCDFGCKHKSSLRIHKRVHAGDITDEKLDIIYRCDVCSQHFYDRNNLTRHLKIHGEKTYACDVCGKLFNNKGDLGKHNRIHTGEKPYACKFCGIRFRVSASLIRHTRSHTGEKPYVCETCGKCFNQKYHLNSHMKVHTGDKPYTCDGCDKAFSHKATLDMHIKKKHSMGEVYKCPICFRCFSSIENLDAHKITHDGITS